MPNGSHDLKSRPTRSLKTLVSANSSAVDKKLPDEKPEFAEELPKETKSCSKCPEDQDNVKVRRSLRNIANSRKSSEEKEKCEEEKKPPTKSVRILRSANSSGGSKKSPEEKSEIREQLPEETKSCSKCPEDQDNLKLRRSLRNAPNSRKSSDENEKCEEEKKPPRRSSTRYSLTRKSLSADKSTSNGSLYVSALEDMLVLLFE